MTLRWKLLTTIRQILRAAKMKNHETVKTYIYQQRKNSTSSSAAKYS